MGNVIDPKPPQWQRREERADIKDDAVLSLVARLVTCATTSVEPDIVVMAALRMVQKAAITTYQLRAGKEATAEMLRQAAELAAQYTINGVSTDDT